VKELEHYEAYSARPYNSHLYQAVMWQRMRVTLSPAAFDKFVNSIKDISLEVFRMWDNSSMQAISSVLETMGFISTVVGIVTFPVSAPVSTVIGIAGGALDIAISGVQSRLKIKEEECKQYLRTAANLLHFQKSTTWAESFSIEYFQVNNIRRIPNERPLPLMGYLIVSAVGKSSLYNNNKIIATMRIDWKSMELSLYATHIRTLPQAHLTAYIPENVMKRGW
jgi:hypothetical protein